MKITAESIFWLSVLDKAETALIVVSLLLFFLGALLVVMAIDKNRGLFLAFICIVLSLMVGAAWVVIPNGETLSAMRVVPAVMQGRTLEDVSRQVLEITEDYFRDGVSTVEQDIRQAQEKLFSEPTCEGAIEQRPHRETLRAED